MRFVVILLAVWTSSWCTAQESKDSIVYSLSGDLPMALVRGERTYAPSVTRLNQRHILALPASFDDPARLLQSYPSISTSNDQANSINYRGLPSVYNTWTIGGAEIINPNHLSNAGTRLDIGSLDAGGVNMFSGQIIDNMTFGINQAASTSTIGPSIDLDIGMQDSTAAFGQLSLIGLEAGIKAPIGPTDWYVLTNTRYSFTGLLADMGVSFDGEEIRFSDIVGQIGKQSEDDHFKLMFAYGNSSNQKSVAEDTVQASLKDVQEIDYTSKQVITSAQYQRKIGSGHLWSTTLNYSQRNGDRSAFVDPDFANINYQTTGSIQDRKLAFQSRLKLAQGWELALNVTDVDEHVSLYIGPSLTGRSLITLNRETTLSQVGVGYTYLSSPIRISATSYLNHVNYFDQEEVLATYRLQAKWQASRRLSFEGIHRRQQQANPLITDIGNSTSQANISIGYHSQLSVLYNYGARWTLTAFHHLINEVPYADDAYFYGEPMVILEGGTQWFTDGKRRTYGIEAGVENSFNESLSYQINGSLFNSETKRGSENSWRPSFYDVAYAYNATLAKRWLLSNNRKLLTSLSYKMRGGFRQRAIENNLGELYTTVYGAGSYQLADYHRLDLRISYDKGRSRWSLDIQNVLGRANEAYDFHDPYLDQVLTQDQLRLIPVLSYRREI